MAEIEYSDEDEYRTAEYFHKDECIVFSAFKNGPEFFCLWTPKNGAYFAYNQLYPLGIVADDLSPGLVESDGVTYETENRQQTFAKVLELDAEKVDYIRLGPSGNCFVIQKSPTGAGHCCGMGGHYSRLPALGTALALTAPHSLIRQYAAMRARLVSYTGLRAYPQSG